MGMRWQEQKLREAPCDVIARAYKTITTKIEEGTFNAAEWDHNSPDYGGVSNKQATIVAAWYLDLWRKGDRDLEWPEARTAFLRVCGILAP